MHGHAHRNIGGFQYFRHWSIKRQLDPLNAPDVSIVAFLKETNDCFGIIRMIAEYRALRRTYRLVHGRKNVVDAVVVRDYLERVLYPAALSNKPQGETG
jgi:hypothetical protein